MILLIYSSIVNISINHNNKMQKKTIVTSNGFKDSVFRNKPTITV